MKKWKGWKDKNKNKKDKSKRHKGQPNNKGRQEKMKLNNLRKSC